jgi:hypothetical protein
MPIAPEAGRQSRRRASLLLLILVAMAAGAVSCSRGSSATAADSKVDPLAPPTGPARAPVLAQVTSEWSYLRVEILEVTRATATRLDVRLAFVNTSASGEQVVFGSNFAAAPADRDTIADIAVIDAAARKKYYILRDREDRPLCSGAIPSIAAGARRVLTASFPAPAATTTTIGLRIPHVPPIDGIPVSEAGTAR